MKKKYIKPHTVIVEIGTETRYLLSGSDALSNQSLDFDMDDSPSTKKWGFYTGNSYSELDDEWGN